MAGEYTLSVLIKAQNQAGGALSGFMKNIDAAHASVLGLAVGGAAAIVGFTAASVQMAATYDQGMRKVQALTGANTQEMKSYDSSLKQLAVNAGVAPTQLTDGLYNVLSASYKGADAVRVLTLATEDSKIGMTSATVTTDALTNVLRSFGTQSKDITRVNGEMLQTVTLGKATFEQYASTIVKSASSASQFHVSMETMNAAWATMTSSGIRAAQASTDFQQSLKVMYGNIGTVTKSLNKSGIAFNENKFNAMSYGDKVKYLNAALEQANAKHVKVTGVTLQAAQAVSTIAKHIGDYNSNLASLSDKQAMAKKTQEAWAITQGGFNQSMSRLQASTQVLMITIGQALIPVLTKIVGAITPIITGFTKWLSTGQNMQTFLAILGGVLAGFAVVILAIVVPAMWAWAVATIAATWPILLIGAIVAVVVIGIILAIQHWGAISKWLQQAWNTALKAIGSFFSWLGTHVHQILSTIGDFFSALGTRVHAIWDGIVAGLRAAWNVIVTVVKIAIATVLIVLFGPIIAIGALFVWLYKHNYYFKALCDAIVNFFKAAIAWIQNAWSTAIAWLGAKWQAITQLATSIWNKISSAIETAAKWIWNQLVSIWTTVTSWLGAQWNKFATLARTAWQMVSGVFSSIWNTYIAGPLGSLWNSFSSWFGTLAGNMLQFGKNLIQNLINGILSMAGAVGNAVSGVAQNIKNFLGFHSPSKLGPGSDAHTWAPNLMKMYAQGIQGGLPGIKVAVNKAAELMKAGLVGDANQLNQKINQAQYQLYLDKKAQVDAKYREREAKHYDTWLADQHKRYEKYLQARQKALDTYDKAKHHKKAFHYHDFKMGKFKPLKETLPKFTGLSLGAFANQTNILDPDLGNGAPMALPASQTSANKPVVHVDNSVNLTIHGSVVDHTKLMNEIQKLQDKKHRMSGLHTPVTSGGRAR